MTNTAVAKQGKESWIGLVQDLGDTLRSLRAVIVNDREPSSYELEWDDFFCPTCFFHMFGCGYGFALWSLFQRPSTHADLDVPLQLARELHGNAALVRLSIEDLWKQARPDADTALLRKEIESAIGWLAYLLMWVEARPMVNSST